MEDRILVIVAVSLAILGLLLLWLAKPETTDRYVLKGTVSNMHGRNAVVTTNVTLIGKNLSKGKAIEREVFWNGEAFVTVT